jgi:hypothetical protein
MHEDTLDFIDIFCEINSREICMLALMIERVAELECGLFWSQNRRELNRLKVTEF